MADEIDIIMKDIKEE
ncbi:Protein of unknown function [Lactobacillus acidophilus DSM 9126]|nr:Protein of unknown function [Lactobacillus acidophilus DSM 9126]